MSAFRAWKERFEHPKRGRFMKGRSFQETRQCRHSESELGSVGCQHVVRGSAQPCGRPLQAKAFKGATNISGARVARELYALVRLHGNGRRDRGRHGDHALLHLIAQRTRPWAASRGISSRVTPLSMFCQARRREADFAASGVVTHQKWCSLGLAPSPNASVTMQIR